MLDKSNFNINKASIFRLAEMPQKKADILQKIFFWLCFVFFFLFLLAPERKISFLGGLTLCFFLSFLFWYFSFFVKSKSNKLSFKTSLEKSLRNQGNLAEFFDLKSARVIRRSIKGDSYTLIHNLVKEDPDFIFVFRKIGISFSEIKNFMNLNDLHEAIVLSLNKALERGESRACLADLLVALSEINPLMKEILFQENLDQEDIALLSYWIKEFQEKNEREKHFWEKKNLMKKGSLAGDWAFGYTVTLDKFSIDWTAVFRKRGFPETLGHRKEIQEMERVLSRGEINNVLLVGEAGIGKKSMIYALAQKSFNGESLPEVNYQRVVELDMPLFLAQVENNEDVERILEEIFKETASSGNIILVISDFENYIGSENQPGKLDVSGVLAPFLQLPQFQVVALTNPLGYRENIEKRSAISSFFEKIEVSETSEKETISLLLRASFFLERKYKIEISYSALKGIVSYAEKYLPNSFFPKKALDILDEASIFVNQTKEKTLLPQHVAKIISEKSNVPVGEMNQKEKNILLDLENLMHQRIINQEKAVSEIASALRRARTEVSQGQKPMGTFLFLGPTGVGKTETAKALASCYFGSEKKIVRLDMSEFQNLSDIPKLIGSPDNQGFLTSKTRENPFSLILLDEIEKAHPDILNIFLQILDEGHVMDGLQRKVDFRNTIIIATSNAGAQAIITGISQKRDWQEMKKELLDSLFQENIFRPELINRFDAVVLFEPLSQENLLKISDLLLNQVSLSMEKKGIVFLPSQELKQALVEEAYDPKFGARELKRTIQNRVEDVLASALLNDKIKKGGKVGINPKTFEILTF
jgi:ATP-dependent Clp protease ATP-binding subunit ClpC